MCNLTEAQRKQIVVDMLERDLDVHAQELMEMPFEKSLEQHREVVRKSVQMLRQAVRFYTA